MQMASALRPLFIILDEADKVAVGGPAIPCRQPVPKYGQTLAFTLRNIAGAIR